MAKKLASRTGSWSKKLIGTRNKNKKKWLAATDEGRKEAKLNPSILSLLRIRKGLRQLDLAKSLSIADRSFSQIERGHRPVKKDVANKIAAYLGVPITKIFEPHPELKRKFNAVIQKSII